MDGQLHAQPVPQERVMSFHTRLSSLCVGTETESMAAVYPTPHSPQFVCGGHLHAFDRRCF